MRVPVRLIPYAAMKHWILSIGMITALCALVSLPALAQPAEAAPEPAAEVPAKPPGVFYVPESFRDQARNDSGT